MRYSALLFDFDYTLADATEGIVTSVNFALDALGRAPQEVDRIRRTVGMTLTDTFSALTGEEDAETAIRFAALFREKADQVMTGGTSLFACTNDVLTAAKAHGLKTGIVTSKFRYRIEEMLTKCGIANLIDCTIGFEDVQRHKPEPDGLYMAIRQVGAKNKDVLYVGDSVIDAEAAARAGIDFAAVTTGATEADEFSAFPSVLVAKNLSAVWEFACN